MLHHNLCKNIGPLDQAESPVAVKLCTDLSIGQIIKIGKTTLAYSRWSVTEGTPV